MRNSNAEVLVLLKAFDETFSTIVQTRTSYTYDDMVWGARFANAFMADAAKLRQGGRAGNNDKVAMDMRLFDIIEPVVDAIKPLNIPRRSRKIARDHSPDSSRGHFSGFSCCGSAGNCVCPRPQTNKWRNYG